MPHYHTIVVGLGAMGSAAIYQLSKRGAPVLGIDQYSPPHQYGSSYGETRITRLAIGEGSAYTPLAVRSHEIWREIEHATGSSLLTATGGLIISRSGAVSGFHGKSDFFERTVRSAEQFGLDHELLSSSSVRKRFPQFKVKDGDRAYYEHGAGFLRPEICIKAQLELATAAGAEIRINEKVMEVETNGGGVRVSTGAGTFFAENLVISTGPWADELLGESLRQHVKIYRQVQYWFDFNDVEQFNPSAFPVFIWDFGDGDGIYGFPAVDGKDGGIKIAAEEFHAATTPDLVDRSVSDSEKAEMYSRRVKPFLDGVNQDCLRARTCLYTVTPDSDFIVDFLPESPQIIVASPCSGHGFKHSAAIGEILAELALDGKSKFDISRFRLGRFTE